MQIARMQSPLTTFGRMRSLDRGGRVAGDHAGLHAGLAQHRHRGDVADLGDLLEDQRGVEDRQAEPAVFLRHRHAEHAELGELLHVLPRERAVHPAPGLGLELGLRQLAHRGDHLALFGGDSEIHVADNPVRGDAHSLGVGGLRDHLAAA